MDLWHHVLSAIERHVSGQCFETWFKPIGYQGQENGTLRLSVPTESFRSCLLEKYSGLIVEIAGRIFQSPLKLSISIDSTAYSEGPAAEGTEGKRPESLPLLMADYDFESFVVGGSNQLAHAAALAVAERPSKSYNPLYLYGGTGLGKTHLINAIGHRIMERNKSLRLAYIAAEKFMNDFINAIRFDHTMRFRRKYRDIDVLLMDDIQFIAGKERTQEEFFHTFNALYDAQKQIVITSDCPPRQIATLEERMHSRFEWGLIADIQPPDLETKLAILRKKAESRSLKLHDDVALFIANGIRSNVRELEGALNRLIASASLDGLDAGDIDVGYAGEVLKGFVADGGNAAEISTENVIRAVSAFFQLKPAQLKAKTNSRQIALPRQIAMYLCKELTNQSLPKIGRDFGGKHHTTVLHSIRKIDSLKKKNPEISSAVDSIVKSLR
jgi:chromosomal replication initiator protein